MFNVPNNIVTDVDSFRMLKKRLWKGGIICNGVCENYLSDPTLVVLHCVLYVVGLHVFW